MDKATQQDHQQKPNFEIEEVEVESPGKVPPKVIEEAVKMEGRYALLGLLLGAIVVIAGLVFIVLGFTASVDITVEGGGTKGHIVTGSLGLVLALAGIALVYYTRYRVKIVTPKAAE
jgi:hypothetical protein